MSREKERERGWVEDGEAVHEPAHQRISISQMATRWEAPGGVVLNHVFELCSTKIDLFSIRAVVSRNL